MNTDPAYVQSLIDAGQTYTDRRAAVAEDLPAHRLRVQGRRLPAALARGLGRDIDLRAVPEPADHGRPPAAPPRAPHRARSKALSKYPDQLRTIASTVQRDVFYELPHYDRRRGARQRRLPRRLRPRRLLRRAGRGRRGHADRRHRRDHHAHRRRRVLHAPLRPARARAGDRRPLRVPRLVPLALDPLAQVRQAPALGRLLGRERVQARVERRQRRRRGVVIGAGRPGGPRVAGRALRAGLAGRAGRAGSPWSPPRRRPRAAWRPPARRRSGRRARRRRRRRARTPR